MPEQWRYRGKTIDSEQVAQLRELIAAHPESSRWKLSRQLCEALGWKQPNGALRDVVCRGLLLMLERAGQIELPPVRRIIRGQRRNARPRPAAVLIDRTPIQGEVAASMRNRKTPQNNCHSGGDINRLIKIFTVIPGHPIPRRLRQFAGM